MSYSSWKLELQELNPVCAGALKELMRCAGDEQLELCKLVVSGFMPYVLLLDVDDPHMPAISSGLARLWPELSELVNQPVLPHMSSNARHLIVA
jgi:hypothetical protein